jgi:hypothetical protein
VTAAPMPINRRYRNFAPFVRQTSERKAQTCAMGILRQLRMALGGKSQLAIELFVMVGSRRTVAK